MQKYFQMIKHSEAEQQKLDHLLSSGWIIQDWHTTPIKYDDENDYVTEFILVKGVNDPGKQDAIKAAESLNQSSGYTETKDPWSLW